MKNILGVFAVFVLPIYFIASSHISPNAAEQITNVEKTETSEEKTKFQKFRKFDNSPATQEKLKKYRDSLPQNISKEIEDFHSGKLKLKTESEKLYKNLSQEAKIALKEERKIRLIKK